MAIGPAPKNDPEERRIRYENRPAYLIAKKGDQLLLVQEGGCWTFPWLPKGKWSESERLDKTFSRVFPTASFEYEYERNSERLDSMVVFCSFTGNEAPTSIFRAARLSSRTLEGLALTSSTLRVRDWLKEIKFL